MEKTLKRLQEKVETELCQNFMHYWTKIMKMSEEELSSKEQAGINTIYTIDCAIVCFMSEDMVGFGRGKSTINECIEFLNDVIDTFPAFDTITQNALKFFIENYSTYYLDNSFFFQKSGNDYLFSPKN